LPCSSSALVNVTYLRSFTMSAEPEHTHEKKRVNLKYVHG
jgi:hypothetical protein